MSETANTKPAWWISWFSPEDLGGFELYWPFWRSGWLFDREEKEWTVFVAAVRADTEDEAFSIVEDAYFEKPVTVQRRFAEKIEDESHMPWTREGTRFPLEEWMTWQ